MQASQRASEDNIGDKNCYVVSQLPTKTRTRLSLSSHPDQHVRMATLYLDASCCREDVFLHLQGSRKLFLCEPVDVSFGSKNDQIHLSIDMQYLSVYTRFLRGV